MTKTRRKYHFVCLVLHTLMLISLMKQVSLIDVPVAYKASVAGNYRTH